MRFQITNKTSGAVLGIYEGADRDEAVRAMLADAGITPDTVDADGNRLDDDSDLDVTEVQADEADAFEYVVELSSTKGSRTLTGTREQIADHGIDLAIGAEIEGNLESASAVREGVESLCGPGAQVSHVVVVATGAVYGCGETIAAACKDARQWLDAGDHHEKLAQIERDNTAEWYGDDELRAVRATARLARAAHEDGACGFTITGRGVHAVADVR